MKKSTLASLLATTAMLALASVLTGCGHGEAEPPPASADAAASYLAVARGSIEVDGGMLPLSAAVSGVVARVDVHVGDHVKSGQPMAQLQDQTARAAVSIARGRLEQARADARLVDVQLKAARARARTLAEAAAAGAGAGQNARDAATHVEQLKARGAAAEAAVSVARGQLQQAQRALDLHTVRAPMAAQVTEANVQPGESVSAGTGSLFTLLPDAPRIVVAEINSRYVERIHAGMQAKVVLDNDDEQVVGNARVTDVGQVFGPSTLEQDPSERVGTRTVKCRLRFDHPHALRIGQRVLVRFETPKAASH